MSFNHPIRTFSMSTFNYDSLFNCLLDLKVRYISIPKTIFNWYKNKDIEYTVLSLEDVRSKYKKSDTIFILGGSESINGITQEQWDHIAQHDSIGMNWWPVHKFVPTYYYTNYPRGNYFSYFESLLERKLAGYNRTVFFVSGNKAARRGIHPRISKKIFSESPICCYYEISDPIDLGSDKKNMVFRESSFERTLYYRGGLTLILDLINRLRYNKIVLMGIDLKNGVHFYDSYPEMQWQFETGYSKLVLVKKKEIHSTMGTKNNSKLPMSEYLYAVNDLFFKLHKINLFVGSNKSVLLDRIPLYRFPV